MERYDAGERVTVDELISSAESGVEVELTRDGKVVARVVAAAEATPEKPISEWRIALEKLHASLPPGWPRTGWSEALREARDDWSA